MIPRPSETDSALRIATLGGGAYAVAVLAWAFSTGVRVTGAGLPSVLFALGYSFLGMALVAGVPLYLLGRTSLLSPSLVAAWSLGNTIYMRWFLARPHDALASYLTVWPLVLGMVGLAALVEFGVRTGIERSTGRFGLRALF